ncbi:MAG TPA: hypothetical protein VJR02_26705 [Pyrinomonadaceae bacterium]|nr:hypothetical protein [Pyrinomonadaceae bacterium]
MTNTLLKPLSLPSPSIRCFSRKRFIIFAVITGLIILGSPTAGLSQTDKPRVREVSVKKITIAENNQGAAVVVFEITGEKFGKTKPSVQLFNSETGASIPANVISHSDNSVTASAQLPVTTKASKFVFQLTVNNSNVISSDHLADFVLEIKREEKKKKEKEKAKPLEITFETFRSEQYPNLYSLLITNKNKDDSPGFLPNPAHMKVDIFPPGATNVAIQPGSSPHQMMVTFLAPEKFDVKAVALTVFDPNSPLGSSEPIAFSTPFKEKSPKADPNQPAISNIDILSLQRRSGFGRLKIEGSGFGEYERPPFPGEKELLCCIYRPRNPDISGEQDLRFTIDESKNISPIDQEVCANCDCQTMRDWRQRIEERVEVLLVPRNPDLRIERTQVMYIDDRVIDVYFEFTHYLGYSEPLRLASAVVTVNKGAVVATQSVTEDASISAVLTGPKTYVSSKDIGPPRDKNLEYRYHILDQNDATRMFGSGVGQNFYVIELVVVNNGKKKVAVPLGMIQAEIEWLYGVSRDKKDFYEEGPPTIPPLPLGSVSSYFDAFQKTEGKWAKVFNILDGATILGASLVPVFGRNIERPVAILSGGLIPGMKRAVGDLSSQQLQNLTTMSWEGIEEILPGGSKQKYVYIPRADQLFGNAKTPEGTRVKKSIINIRGLEVSGFEILESEQKVATPQP